MSNFKVKLELEINCFDYQSQHDAEASAAKRILDLLVDDTYLQSFDLQVVTARINNYPDWKYPA